MIDFLVDKSNATDLAIQYNEEELENLFADIQIEHLRLEDLTLKLDLQKLSRNFGPSVAVQAVHCSRETQ